VFILHHSLMHMPHESVTREGRYAHLLDEAGWMLAAHEGMITRCAGPYGDPRD